MIDRLELERICREAGELAMRQWPGAGHAVESWTKAKNSPVCAADLAVDEFLLHELGTLLPDAGWLSEETADDPVRVEKDLVWVVDPIDGTRDFLGGRRGWAVSVALVGGGKPLIAILAAPARDEIWSAVAGQGAWRDGERLFASGRTELAGAKTPADWLHQEDHDLTMVEKPNSIALRAAMVAAGEADLIATLRWGYEWDVAAAALIAGEAGARVSDAFGQPLVFNKPDPQAFGVLISAPALHGPAVRRLAARAAALSERPK